MTKKIRKKKTNLETYPEKNKQNKNNKKTTQEGKKTIEKR